MSDFTFYVLRPIVEFVTLIGLIWLIWHMFGHYYCKWRGHVWEVVDYRKDASSLLRCMRCDKKIAAPIRPMREADRAAAAMLEESRNDADEPPSVH